MIYFTARIFVKEGKEKVFQQYEELVLPVLKEYSGELIYRIRPTKETFVAAEEELPFEIHFISFNSEKDFSDYANDSRRKEFLQLKDDAIKSTFLVKGVKL